MANNGFLIVYDRFSLVDPSEYILKGYIAPETELAAELDGRPCSLMLQPLTDNVDERYGGAEARAVLHFPEKIPEHSCLKLYAE